jgi:RND superfamily putative drug exporter
MVVAPAVMTLLGDRAWWFPAWLDRLLPHLDPEGRRESEPAAERDRRRAPLPGTQPAPAGASES